jgi:hypothetical protein
MAAVTRVAPRPVEVPGYEVNDKGQAKVALLAGQLLIMTADAPRAGHERVWDLAPAGTQDPHGICLKDCPINGTASVGIQGEMDGFSGMTPGGAIYSSGSVAGGLDTTALTIATTPAVTVTARMRATTASRLRFSFV